MIEVVGLCKRYATTDALRGLNFQVGAGEIFGFVGPNGAGKTTTIRALATLLRPDAGSIVVDGVDVLHDPQAARVRIGYMPDFFGVYDQLTASEYLRFYASCYRIRPIQARRIAADLLELVSLGDKSDVPVDTLSRGMKQRLCLARALVHDPAVLLLDEPASGLDPRARVEMRELLRELQRMGKTIVISSHILPELAEMCTVFGIIDAGRMVVSGPMESLLQADGRSRARLRLAGDRDRAMEGIVAAGFTVYPGEADDSVEVEYVGGEEKAVEVLARLVGAGVPIFSFQPVASNLEDVFLRVTQGPDQEVA